MNCLRWKLTLKIQSLFISKSAFQNRSDKYEKTIWLRFISDQMFHQDEMPNIQLQKWVLLLHNTKIVFQMNAFKVIYFNKSMYSTCKDSDFGRFVDFLADWDFRFRHLRSCIFLAFWVSYSLMIIFWRSNSIESDNIWLSISIKRCLENES